MSVQVGDCKDCGNPKLLVYDVIDYTGAVTRHLAMNEESAVQAHLVHLGLSSSAKTPNVQGAPLKFY